MNLRVSLDINSSQIVNGVADNFMRYQTLSGSVTNGWNIVPGSKFTSMS